MHKKIVLLMCIDIPIISNAMDLFVDTSEHHQLAICLSEKLFDCEDKEMVDAFTRILKRDKKDNHELTVERYRMIKVLKGLKDSKSCSESSSASR